MFLINLLTIIPVIIWMFLGPIAPRFYNLNSITTSLGQILGLMGMVLFSINLILAGRFKFLDKYFKGLDKVYANHHKIGAVAFSMMIFHPIFLVVKYLLISTREAALFFVPFNNTPITFGILALLGMIILIVMTFYVKLKYHKWKISHKFMTLVFIFAILHTFLISSDVSRNDLLRYYILGLAIIGLFSVFRKTFLEVLKFNRYKYKIKKVNLLNNEIVEIEMVPEKKRMKFIPGQFAFFIFSSDHVGLESHPFSISSSATDNNLKIIAKNFGDYTSQLKSLKVGDIVFVDGSYGGFSYKKTSNKNQIWIAGGIGITPFLSMIQTLENDYNVDLYYSIKENGEAVHVKDLQNVAEKNSNLKYNLWVTKEKGYISGQLISDMSNGLDSKDIFLCGPSAFMESLKDQFVSLGVDIKKIHYENFSF